MADSSGDYLNGKAVLSISTDESLPGLVLFNIWTILKSDKSPSRGIGMKTMADKLTTAAAYTTSSATFLAGSMSLNEWLAIGGFILAVLTFGVNVYFQRKRDRREEKLSEKRWGVKNESDNPDTQL